MTLFRRVRTALHTLAAAVGAIGASGVAAQPLPLDSLFGIRIGQAVEAQLAECPKNEKGTYDPGFQKTEKACWVPGQYGKEVRLPQKILAESRILFSSNPRITTRDGVVVEIDVYAPGQQWRDVERYLMRVYGKPQETETYLRDSRVSGRSKVQMRTWRANGIAMHFDPHSGSEDARIRMVSEAWEALDSKERRQRALERGARPL